MEYKFLAALSAIGIIDAMALASTIEPLTVPSFIGLIALLVITIYFFAYFLSKSTKKGK